jgi:hypothetical protein
VKSARVFVVTLSILTSFLGFAAFTAYASDAGGSFFGVVQGIVTSSSGGAWSGSLNAQGESEEAQSAGDTSKGGADYVIGQALSGLASQVSGNSSAISGQMSGVIENSAVQSNSFAQRVLRTVGTAGGSGTPTSVPTNIPLGIPVNIPTSVPTKVTPTVPAVSAPQTPPQGAGRQSPPGFDGEATKNSSQEFGGQTQSTVQQSKESLSQLENVGTSLHSLQTLIHNANTDAQATVSHDLDNAVKRAEVELNGAPDNGHKETPVTKQEKKEAKVNELKQVVSRQRAQLINSVRSSITVGAIDEQRLNDVKPALESSLSGIAHTIENSTGAQVDLSSTARVVASDVQEQAKQFKTARDAFLARDGLDLYTDSDHDGISDYDEVHIYHTDPHNAHTAGGALTDGENVLRGFDVNASSTRSVPVESPLLAGEETKKIFEVTSIAVEKRPAEVTSTTPSSAGTLPQRTVVPVAPAVLQVVKFAGRALPNSFVTLYIFSTPIVVTVKADASGSWKYTLDSELPDGNHALYVATVDAGGKILAKSPAIPFVKTAEAAEFTPLTIAETPTVDPLDVLRTNMITVSLVGVLVFAIVALMFLGARRADRKNDVGGGSIA